VNHRCEELSPHERALLAAADPEVPGRAAETLANLIRPCAARSPMCQTERHVWMARRKPATRQRARSVLVLIYAPWGLGVAKNLHRRLKSLVELDDVRQKVSLGLLEAIDRFDLRRGRPFIAYAIGRIMHRVFDAEVERFGGDYRLVRDVLDAEDVLTGRLQRQPTPDEIAGALGIGVGEVIRAFRRVSFTFPCSADHLPALELERLSDGGAGAREVERTVLKNEAISTLSPDGQTRVNLYVVGNTAAEIASLENTRRPKERQVSENTIHKSLHRSRRQMARVVLSAPATPTSPATAPIGKGARCQNR
jgi:DNA-directed RNA polymerase specialized sigma subunit